MTESQKSPNTGIALLRILFSWFVVSGHLWSVSVPSAGNIYINYVHGTFPGLAVPVFMFLSFSAGSEAYKTVKCI